MNTFIPEHNWINWVDTLAEHHYVVIDNLLPAEMLSGLVESMHRRLKEQQFAKAAIGTSSHKQIDRSIRGDHILWLDKASTDMPVRLFTDFIEELKSKINRDCYLSLSGYEFHFAHYPVGTFYKRHLDQFNSRDNRMISVVLYLNEAWKPEYGGGLQLFLDDSKEVILPAYGRLVLFKSNVLEHEVMITHADRYSITGWMLYQPPGLGFMA